MFHPSINLTHSHVVFHSMLEPIPPWLPDHKKLFSTQTHLMRGYEQTEGEKKKRRRNRDANKSIIIKSRHKPKIYESTSNLERGWQAIIANKPLQVGGPLRRQVPQRYLPAFTNQPLPCAFNFLPSLRYSSSHHQSCISNLIFFLRPFFCVPPSIFAVPPRSRAGCFHLFHSDLFPLACLTRTAHAHPLSFPRHTSQYVSVINRRTRSTHPILIT